MNNIMSIGIAIIGTGRIAEVGFIPAISKINGVKIASVLSRDRLRGKEFAKKHNIDSVYTDIDLLLNDPLVDAVIICTPDAMHESQVIKACRSGKHVLCEKPMSSVNSCLKMIAEIEKSKIIFAMGFNNRFNAGLKYIKNIIKNNEIGQIRYARAFVTTPQNDPNGWRAVGQQSAFWALSATGTHMIDIWRWYFGNPSSICASCDSPLYGGPNDEISNIIFEYKDKLLAEITAAAILPRANRIEIYSETDSIVGENVFGIVTDEIIFRNGKKVDINPCDSFFEEVNDFIDSISRNTEPKSTYKDGLENLMIMEKSREHNFPVDL